MKKISKLCRIAILLFGIGLLGIFILWILSVNITVPAAYSAPVSQHPTDFISDLGLRGDIIAFARYFDLLWLIALFVVLLITSLLLLLFHFIQQKFLKHGTKKDLISP